nr:uncharacterized protein LOC127309112 [Lolium perenne]
MRCAASLGARNPPSAHGLRQAVGFFAYSEHRRRALTLAAATGHRPCRGRLQAAAAAAATPPLLRRCPTPQPAPTPAAAPHPGRRASSSCAAAPSPSTSSSTPTTADVGLGTFYPMPDGAAIVVESFSTHARCWQHRRVPSSTTCPRAWQTRRDASSTSTSSVYACPVLATPMRAFVHDVSPGPANPARRPVNTVFFPAHHYLNTTAPTSNLAPPCARGSTATNSTPATPTRHRPRHLSHGYLDHGYTTLRSRLPRPRHKGLPPCLSNLAGFHSSHNIRDVSTVTTVVGMSIGSAFGFFSSLIVYVATL